MDARSADRSDRDYDEQDIADHLNSLERLGMRHMAAEEDLRAVICDYFTADVESDEEEEEEQETATFVEETMPTSVSQDPAQTGDAEETRGVIEDMSLHFIFTPPSPHVIPEQQEGFMCNCHYNNGEPCATRFEEEETYSLRLQYMGLSKDELDIAVMEDLSSGMHVGSLTQKSRRGQQTQRKASRTDFYIHGHQVCREFYLYIHCMSLKRLKNLVKHYKENGIEPRMHGNIKRQPAHALSYDDILNVFQFISNYAEANAIILPGRQPYSWKTDCKLLPSNCSKRTVYDLYREVVENTTGMRCVSHRSFLRIWQQLLPFITNLKPATDLCWYCQQRSVQLQRCTNLPHQKKSKAAQEMLRHLEEAAAERALYNSVVEEVRNSLPAGSALGRHPCCSFIGKNHYSFDFAQQVHYPYNPQQPGPIFFKTPRKCGLFGVNAEGLTRQINFLLDEAWNFGKGANCVISLIHFFFEVYGLGETEAHLHADNCCGQNKNNAMLQYLLWRVLTGRHTKITLSFLLAGHTKFACDWSFGLIKRLFRKTEIGCLQDISHVINKSSIVNCSQLCITEHGEMLVMAYDWTSFLDQFFVKVPKILSFHHFHFESGSGFVRAQEFCTSPLQNFLLLRANVSEINPSILPSELTNAGLDLKRKSYLYKEIRPFVPPEHQDTVAPLPDEPDEPGPSTPTTTRQEPLPKVPRVTKSVGQGKGKGRGKGRKQ